MLAQSSGPDTRQITDAKTITSATNPNARPIPIDDLYFTRSVSNASWSPEGNEIVFTTDLSGRSNLWNRKRHWRMADSIGTIRREAIQRNMVSRWSIYRIGQRRWPG